MEQTAKNCRILQFKLRKAERRMEQLETDKHELEIQNQEFRNNSAPSTVGPTPGRGQDRISQLEQELNHTREQLAQSQREVQKLQSQIRIGSKDVLSSGPVLSKSRSLEVTVWLKNEYVQSDKFAIQFCYRGQVVLRRNQQRICPNYKEIFKIRLKEKQIFANNSNLLKKR